MLFIKYRQQLIKKERKKRCVTLCLYVYFLALLSRAKLGYMSLFSCIIEQILVQQYISAVMRNKKKVNVIFCSSLLQAHVMEER